MQNELDSLNIVISADTRKASQSINQLIKKLGSLRNTFKTLNNLHGGIRPLTKGLQDIAKIDFSGVEQSLANIASILKSFEQKNVVKNLEALANMGNAQASATATASETKAPELTPIQMALGKLDSFSKEINKMNFSNYNQVAKNLEDFVKQMDENARKYGGEFVKVHQGAIKLLNRANKKINKTFEGKEALTGRGQSNPIGNFASRVINRAVFSLVRFIIQAIKDLVKELIGTFAKVDDNFNKIISEAYSGIKYLKRAIEASLAPVITLLAPIVTMLANVLGDVLNEVAKWTAMLAGQDYYYKAKYSVENFADTLKKASATLGIDELNILQQDEDLEELFEKESIKAYSVLPKIANSLTKLEPLLKDIARSLLVMPIQLLYVSLLPLTPLLTQLAVSLDMIMGTYEMLPSLFDSLVEGIVNGNWAKLQIWGLKWVQMIVEAIRPITSVIQFLYNAIRTISNAIIDIYNGLARKFHWNEITWGGLPELDWNSIFDVITSMDADSIYSNQQKTKTTQLDTSNENSFNETIVIQLDGETIAKAVNKRNNNRGANLGFGGSINWNKGF